MSFEIEFNEDAKDDLEFHKRSGNKKVVAKIFDLIKAISENPFDGIGKPEPLKHSLNNYWSRRINREHRIVYRVSENLVEIFSLKGHYEK